MKSTKFCALLLFSVMIVGLFALSPTFSSLMNSVVINSTGKISLLSITAKSGSPADIQAAVNVIAAAGGGTVYIPAGNFAFNPPVNGIGVTIPPGVSVIGAGMDVTILQETVNSGVDSIMFYSDGQINYGPTQGPPVRISGITFVGFVVNETVTSNTGVEIIRSKDFRVDHCKFIDFAHFAIYTTDDTGGTYPLKDFGVIDHCVIDNPYKDRVPSVGDFGAYGIGVVGDVWYWQNLSDLLGQFDNPNASAVVYIENCNFSRCRHAVSGGLDGYYIVRYCTFSEERPKNFGMVDVHGFNNGRGLEAYNNTFYASDGYDGAQAFWIRGGGGCIFNNTIINCLYGVMLAKESDPPYSVHDLYVWGNTQSSGTPFQSDPAYIENVDYFLYARPNYTPYPYPHPLTFQTTP